MKRTFLKAFLALPFLAAAAPSMGQNNASAQAMNVVVSNGSFSVSLRHQNLSRETVLASLNGMLGLSDDHTFEQTSEDKDNAGYTHVAYQQYYKGVPVRGGEVLMHLKDGKVMSLNGKIAPVKDCEVQPAFDAAAASDIARKAAGVVTLMQRYTPELVLTAGPDKETPYVPAYKVRIDGKTAEKKVVMYQVYVDARTGKVLQKIPLIAHADVPAAAKTLYSGLQTITTDSYNGAYRLHDNARKIETYNAGGQFPTENPANLNPFDTAREYMNATTTWDEVSTLESIELTSSTHPGFLTGLGINSVIAALVGEGTFTNLDDVSPLTLNILYTANAFPIINSGISVPLPDGPSYAGFGKVDFFGNLQDSAFFSLSDTSIGTHNWSNTTGSGKYTIVLAQNPALDAHWGMEKTHDFYNQVFDRDSYDGNGSTVKNYVNGAIAFAGTQDNAVALPEPYNSMVYGLGDGDVMGPVVGLDVMGHEFTHMVTEHNGHGGLEYQGESGALNESFSDMMGTSIEFFVKGDSANWTVGEGVALQAPHFFRSLSNPKAPGNLNPNFPAQPDTYHGDYWFPTTSQQDEGGVHINSGVPNKWFYLVSEGGSGTNDNHYQYNVSGIGIDKAEQIAYRTWTNYLTSTATFLDAYNGSLQAAADLYNENSPEYNTVKEAWAAVGVPYNDSTSGISPVYGASPYVKIYPNPATDFVTIASSWVKPFEADIYSMTGATLMHVTVNPGQKNINVAGLSKGIYIIRYTIGDAAFMQKITLK